MTAMQAPPKADPPPLQSLFTVRNKLMKPHQSCFGIHRMMDNELRYHHLSIVVSVLPVRNRNKNALPFLPQASEGDCPPMLRGVFESHLSLFRNIVFAQYLRCCIVCCRTRACASCQFQVGMHLSFPIELSLGVSYSSRTNASALPPLRLHRLPGHENPGITHC